MKLPRSHRKLMEIGKKYGLSAATADDIMTAYWESIKNTIESSDARENYYPIIEVRRLGKFIVTDARKFVLINKMIPRYDQRRHQILQSLDRLSGDTEDDSSETTEGEDTMAGEN